MRVPPAGGHVPTCTSSDTEGMTWFTGLGLGKTLTKAKSAVLMSVAAAARAAHCVDFYHHQIQQQETSVLQSVDVPAGHVFNNLEAEEQKERQAQVAASDQDCRLSAAVDPKRRARRVLFRICHAANRSFWLSCTELYVILVTGGAGWQTHMEKVLFLAKVVFMAQQTKRVLTNKSQRSLPAHNRCMDMLQISDAQDETEEDVAVLEDTTSLVDDYLHRGPHLRAMSLYCCSMHILRVEKRARNINRSDRFMFDSHYKLAPQYCQQLKFYCQVPRLVSQQLPTLAQDEEANCMHKSVLFVPVCCAGPGQCQGLGMFECLLAKSARGSSWHFRPAWKTFRYRVELLASQSSVRERLAKRISCIADCGEFRRWLPSEPSQRSFMALCLRTMVANLVAWKRLPHQCVMQICSYLCVKHTHVLCKNSGAMTESCALDPLACGSAFQMYNVV